MRTMLRSKVTLLFLAFAVAIFAVAGMAMAQTTDTSGSTAAAPTIQSDKEDYPPGGLVTLTGGNWQPGETVNIKVNDTYGASWSRNVDVTADANGNITDSFNLPDWFVSDYNVTATGTQSGTAMTTFTDAQPQTVSVTPTTHTVKQGVTSGNYNVSVAMNGSSSNCTVNLSAVGLPTGASASFSNSSPTGNTSTPATSTFTVSTTATGPNTTPTGSDTFRVDATRTPGCQGSGATSSGNLTLVVDPITATSVSNITASTSTFGGTTDLSAKVSPSGAPGSVEFFVNGSSAGSGTYNQSTGVATLSNYTHGLPASATPYSVKAAFTAASGSGYSSSNATNASALTVNKATTTTTVTCTGAPFTYTGNPITPCSASVSGPGLSNESVPVTYTDNTNAGTASAKATYAGTSNYNGSTDTKTFTIGKANTTTTVTCTGAPFTYTGNPITPCSASVSGPGLSNESVPVTYTDNTNAGTASAKATYAGTANLEGSTDTKTFEIGKANTTTTVTCTGAPFTYTSNPITPCSASVSGPGLSNESAPVTYTDNINAGTASAKATYAGTANLEGSTDTKTFEIGKANTTTTVTCTGAPFTYTGNPITPCSASVSGPGLSNESAPVTYTDNINAGTASAKATYAGTTNLEGSTDTKTFEIGKANTTTTVTCTGAPFTYTGNPITPCSASVSGPGLSNESAPVTYTDNTNAGTASAKATYAGTANLEGSTDTKTFEIGKATAQVTLSNLGPHLFDNTAKSATVATTPTGLNVTVTYNGLTPAPTAVGSYNVVATVNNPNYQGQATGTLVINPWTTKGFYQPVDMGDVLNTVKNGSTVPIKFELFSGTTELTSTSAVSSILAKPVSCTAFTGDPEDPIETVTTGGTVLRYDATGGQFIFNWQTPKKPNTCYNLTMTATDGSTITAYFKLK